MTPEEQQGILPPGTFVRVRSDHEYKAGKDGMVIEDFGREIGLFFGFDRHNHPQNCQCVGTELWNKDELDLSTAD